MELAAQSTSSAHGAITEMFEAEKATRREHGADEVVLEQPQQAEQRQHEAAAVAEHAAHVRRSASRMPMQPPGHA